MARTKPQPGEPTEKTPRGFEVRIPKRSEFFSNLKKIARKESASRRSQKKA